MSQTEFSRTPQQPNRRRPLVGLVIVVVLCLSAFALGIFVGKQRQKIAGDVESNAPVTRLVATKPVPAVEAASTVLAVDVVTANTDIVASAVEVAQQGVEAVISGQEVVASASALPQSATAAVGQEAASDSVAKLVTSAEPSPLGSGMNSAPVMPKVAVESDADVDKVVTVVAAAVSSLPPVNSSKPTVAPSSTVYVVQVGSFKKRVDAEKLQGKLQKEYSVVVRNVDLGAKGVWYRVLVGQSATKDAADQLKEQLLARYKVAGFVKKTTL